jgi:hypothetical protein
MHPVWPPDSVSHCRSLQLFYKHLYVSIKIAVQGNVKVIVHGLVRLVIVATTKEEHWDRLNYTRPVM